jgi:hypothetical protein
LAFRAGPPAGPGPSRARTRARSFGGDVPGFLRSMFAWTGRAGTRPGTGPRAGPGPEPARTTGVSTTGRGGGCGASRLRDAGLRPHCSHPPGSFCCCVCLVWCVCALLFLRGPSEPTGGGRAASTPSRGSLGALRRHAAIAAPGSGPFSLLRAVRWPGPGPGRRLHRRPEPPGVIELTRPVALVPSPLSPHGPALEAPAGRWSGSPLPSLFGCTAGSLRRRVAFGLGRSRAAGPVGRTEASRLLLAGGPAQAGPAGGGALRVR